jgi:hypothetical protein
MDDLLLLGWFEQETLSTGPNATKQRFQLFWSERSALADLSEPAEFAGQIAALHKEIGRLQRDLLKQGERPANPGSLRKAGEPLPTAAIVAYLAEAI